MHHKLHPDICDGTITACFKCFVQHCHLVDILSQCFIFLLSRDAAHWNLNLYYVKHKQLWVIHLLLHILANMQLFFLTYLNLQKWSNSSFFHRQWYAAVRYLMKANCLSLKFSEDLLLIKSSGLHFFCCWKILIIVKWNLLGISLCSHSWRCNHNECDHMWR